MNAFRQRLDWERDGGDWPNRVASRFVQACGWRWHVQVAGAGPAMLLIHGTGASTHSWRGLLPLLAERYTVVAPDLPGHGFTDLPSARHLSLPGMAAAVAELMRAMQMQPAFAVGHSAGAAILLRQIVDGAIAPHGIVSLNGALLPFSGAAGRFFSPLAKLIAGTGIVPRLFARRAAEVGTVERLIRGTGSTLDATGVTLYRRLASSEQHVAAALGMVAGWDLDPLVRDLPRVSVPVTLAVGSNDQTIAPSQARRVVQRLPRASVVVLDGLGHLAHEERPDVVASLIVERTGG